MRKACLEVRYNPHSHIQARKAVAQICSCCMRRAGADTVTRSDWNTLRPVPCFHCTDVIHLIRLQLVVNVFRFSSKSSPLPPEKEDIKRIHLKKTLVLPSYTLQSHRHQLRQTEHQSSLSLFFSTRTDKSLIMEAQEQDDTVSWWWFGGLQTRVLREFEKKRAN